MRSEQEKPEVIKKYGRPDTFPAAIFHLSHVIF